VGIVDSNAFVAALASSFEPLETSPKTLRQIQKKIAREKRGFLSRLRSWLTKS
jgi:hypothetical protein